MSLLMDALRRAEAEKKQQEARTADKAPAPDAQSSSPDVDVPVVGSEDMTVQVERAAVERAENDPGARGDGEAREGAPPSEPTLEASATPAPPTPAQTPPGSGSDALELEMEPFEDDGDNSRSMSLSDELSLEPLDSELTFAGLSADDTRSETMEAAPGVEITAGGRTREQTATLPSTRAVQNDLDAYFDHSQSMEVPRRRHVPGDATLEDVAAHTMVGAQTVFSASERPRSRPIFVAAAVLGLLVVAGIGAFGVFFAQQTPSGHPIPSPAVAAGVERTALRELPVVPLEPRDPRAADVTSGLVRLDTRPPADAAPEAPLSVTAAPVTPPPADAPPPPAIATTPPEAPPARLPASASPAPKPAPKPAPGPAPGNRENIAAAASAAVPGSAPEAPSGAPEIGVSAGEVRIARSVRPAGVDETIQAAYEAFSNGDTVTAESLYGSALAANPDRRDALLGLGAIALGKGDLERAYRHYATVLKRFPGDPVASAALLSLTGVDGGATAARLRMLRDSNRNSPFIHFALGNWYARHGRWPDAQQAYFQAVSLETGNADYVYNLAVSLDHMGQSAAALDYYRKSLTLADQAPAGFNPANVLQRIGSLSAAEPR